MAILLINITIKVNGGEQKMRNEKSNFSEIIGLESSFFDMCKDVETFQSNQVLEKNEDGSISGIRYVISPQPSIIRPIKAWTINIEKWICDDQGEILSEGILFIRLLNKPNNYDKAFFSNHNVQEVRVFDGQKKAEKKKGFNAVMAAMLFISKIDSGRMVNFQKILSVYNLL